MSRDSFERERARKETETSFAVEASAGTGKTSALIDRILQLVLVRGPAGEPLPVSAVCAITFTEKAAGEMKLRLRQKLEESAAGGGEEGRRAAEALRELHAANISTVHSFAAALLRERPVEARLDPRFTPLDRNQGRLLFAEFLDAWLGRALEERRPALEAALRAGLPLQDLRELAGQLRDHAGRAAELDFPPPWTDEEANRLRLEMLDEGRQFPQLCGDPEDKLCDALGRALEWLDSPGEKAAPGIAGNKGRAANWQGGMAAVESVRSFIARAKAFAAALECLPRQRLLHAAVCWLNGEFLPAWEEHKRLKGYLEFDDLLAAARDLLRSSPDARSSFQQRYRALLVDEFQDTDPVQLEMVMLLASHRADGGSAADFEAAPGRLFIVGDPKQSIYRFRGADIETYQKVGRRESAQERGLERLELTTNFRSVPSILRFVDIAFESVMRAADGGDYQPDYLAFGGSGHRAEGPVSPSVRLLGDFDAAGEAVGSGPGFFQLECSRIARLIGAICRDDEWQVEDRDAGTGRRRQARFGDIAVLLPVLTKADTLETALQNGGVPYVLEGGKYYYRRSEVASALNVLRAVSNPSDTVALYGALRSIFFGLSDEDLLREHAAGAVLDYRRPVPADSRLHGPFGILADLHGHRNRRLPSETFEMLLHRTGAREVLAPRGLQSAANLMKLAQTLRVLQREATFSQAVDLLSRMDEEDIGESESRIMEERGDAVRLLTIHKAKGLDFPIVIVAGLGLQVAAAHGSICSEPHRIRAYGVRAKLGDSFVSTPEWENLREEEKKREAAELVRLLYVALTRARDHLVVGTHHKGKKEKGGEDFARDLGRTRLEPLGGLLASGMRMEPRPAVILEAQRVDALPLLRAAAEENGEIDVGRRLRREYEELRRLIEETPGAAVGEGAAEGEAAPAAEDLPRDAGPSRAIRLGLAFHEVMETAELGWEGERLQDCVAGAAAGHSLDDAAAAELGEMAGFCMKSGLVARARAAGAAGRGLFRELPFIRAVEGAAGERSMEEGKIDLLFEEGDGWVLVDYKTDRLDAAGDLPAGTRERYGAQMEAYAQALAELGIELKARCLLLARSGQSLEF